MHEGVVCLMTRELEQRLVTAQEVGLAGPRLRVVGGVFDRERVVDGVGSDTGEPLRDHGSRRHEKITAGADAKMIAGREAARLDDEFVAFPAADRIAEPRSDRGRCGLRIEPYDAGRADEL